MKRTLKWLTLLVVTLFICTTAAYALEELTLRRVTVYEDGIMELLLTSDYTGKDDLNFTVTTENGEIEVESAYVLQDLGTSWFVILDYGRNVSSGAVKYATATQDMILSELANLVASDDEGALVMASDNPDITVTNAPIFKQNLTKTPGTTKASAMVSTLEQVMNYITANRVNLMPNICVVLLTTAYEADASVVAQVERILNENVDYTTHVICVAGSEKNYGAANDGWRDRGAKLAAKGSLTLGGTGYLTDTMTDEEARNAVQRVKEAERKLVMLQLNPLTKGVIGHNMTITQNTSSGKVFEHSFELDEEGYDIILKAIMGGTVPIPHTIPSYSGSSTYFNTYPDNTINAHSASNGGLSVELIIAIVMGVVIVILVVVLIIIRTKKSSRSEPAQEYGPVQQVSKTVVTLNGANGVVLKGEFHNGRLTIGRDSGKARLVIQDGKVSGLHVILVQQGNSITLTDNHSTNGTKVNGTKVTGSCSLHQNDVIGLGSTTYTVSWCRT